MCADMHTGCDIHHAMATGLVLYPVCTCGWSRVNVRPSTCECTAYSRKSKASCGYVEFLIELWAGSMRREGNLEHVILGLPSYLRPALA